MADAISGGISNLLRRPTDVRTRRERKGDSVSDYMPLYTMPNFIPSPEALQDKIDLGLEALAKGFYWDRGSIINIVL